jgi:hypothetical protein
MDTSFHQVVIIISIDSSTHEFMIRIDLKEKVISNSDSINKQTIEDEN